MIIVDDMLSSKASKGTSEQRITENSTVRLDALEKVMIFDRHGRPYQFSRFYHTKTAVFVFLRNFLDYVAIEYAQDLAKIPSERLTEKNVQIIVIGCSPVKCIQDFEQLTGLDQVFTDPELVLYTNLELNRKIDYLHSKPSSPHVKSSMISGILSGMMRVMKSMDWHGDLDQQGGILIIEPGNIVKCLHRDKGPFDHMRINEILSLLSIEALDFTN